MKWLMVREGKYTNSMWNGKSCEMKAMQLRSGCGSIRTSFSGGNRTYRVHKQVILQLPAAGVLYGFINVTVGARGLEPSWGCVKQLQSTRTKERWAWEPDAAPLLIWTRVDGGALLWGSDACAVWRVDCVERLSGDIQIQSDSIN